MGTASISNAVGSQGLVTTVAQGATVITATLGSTTGSTTLSVAPPLLVSIGLSPLSPSIPQGTKQQFTATGTFTDGSTRDLTSSVTWTSSASGVATVFGGLATTVAQGATTITASSGNIAASTVLAVIAPALVSIAVTPPNATIVLGNGQQFTATGTYTDGSTKDLTNTATWTSSNLHDLFLTPRGLAEAFEAQGPFTVTASVGSISSSATVNVITIIYMTVQPQNTALPQGETQQMQAEAIFSNNSSVLTDVTAVVNWSSSLPSVATITSTGLVTAVSDGGASITATYPAPYVPSLAVSASTAFGVRPPVVLQVTVAPSPVNVPAGTSQQLLASGTLSTGGKQDLTIPATWTSSNPSVATISPGGLVVGIGPGTATITATVLNPNSTPPSVSGSASITVPALLSAITISPASAGIPLGASQQLVATGTYSDGSTAALTAATWSSSNSVIAAVNAGLVSAVAQGSATITASFADSQGSASITVGPPVLASISITPAHPSLQPGSTQQLAATGILTDKSTEDLTGTVTWASSNDSVASVNSAGLVSTLSIGVSTITAATATLSGATPVGVYAPGQVRFAYVAQSRGTMAIFLVDNAMGLLVPGESTSLPAGILPSVLAADPSGRFLYAASGTSLYTLAIDPLTGSLQPAPGPSAPAPHGVIGVTLSPTGNFLFATDFCCNITTYSIDQNGVITSASQVPGSGVNFVVADPTGRFLYGPDSTANTLDAFAIDPSTGALSELTGSPFALPGQTPWSATVSPSGGYLFVPDANGDTVTVWALDPTTGVPVAAPASYSVGQSPEQVVTDPSGKFVYVMNGGGESNSLSAFTFDSTNGTLTLISGSPFDAGGSAPQQMAVDPLGKFLFVQDIASNIVVSFSIDPSTGALTKTGSVPTATAPASLTLVK